eukprot:2968592-Rhodomonas_salina.1
MPYDSSMLLCRMLLPYAAMRFLGDSSFSCDLTPTPSTASSSPTGPPPSPPAAGAPLSASATGRWSQSSMAWSLGRVRGTVGIGMQSSTLADVSAHRSPGSERQLKRYPNPPPH